MTTPDADAEAVLATNQAFYDAIEACDLDAMTALWEQSGRVSCVHPGWTILRGWEVVVESWERILHGPGQNQFILTNTSVTVAGDLAWVVLDENLVAGGRASTIASTNIFTRAGDGWLMVVHHGSPVMSR